MSFNGSGTFVVNSAGQPVVANTVISATVFNALTADLATGLSTCITKDGQTTVTANIPFGNNKITALGAGTAASDAANLGQVQSTAAKLVTVTGTDTITGTMSPALTAYAAGQLFYFIANAANTGAVTINIDGLGAKSITRDGSTALTGGDINSGEFVVIIYDGTRFQMINAANSFGNTTINGTLTVTGNTALQANVSITSTLSVGGTFAVTGAATLGSTLAVTGKSDLPTVSTASINAAVALITTGTVTNLTASGASIASANIGNLQFTAASIASINAGVAVVTNLTATSASIASMNAGVALLTTATVTSLTATGASVASANVGTAVVTGLTVTGASIASVNAGTATLSGNLTLNGGTANGVLYLDGSKVATSGSSLSFNGTTLTAPQMTLTSANGITMNSASGGLIDCSGNTLFIQFPSSNSLIFRQSGSPFTEYMRLNSTGLGIGTTSPATNLSVVGTGITDASSNGAYQITVDNNAAYNLTPQGGIIHRFKWSSAGTLTTGAGIRFYKPNTNDSDASSQIGFLVRSGIAAQSQAMTLDSSGNLGLGVTPSAWTSNIKALEGASGGALSFYAAGGFPGTFITSNAYSDGTNWIAKVTDQACLYTLEGTTGKHIWSVAASNTTAGNAITFTQAMTLDSSGNLGIGTASPAQKLDVVGSGLFTVSGGNQSIILNTSNNAQNYNGLINFQRQGSVKFYAALDSSDNLAFLNSSASGLLTLNSSGNLGLNVVPVSQNGKVFHIDGGAGAADIRLTNNATGSAINNGGLLTLVGSDIYFWNLENNFLSFGTNNTERARITSAGEFLVGTTTNPINSTAVFSHTGAGIGVGVGDIATPANRTGISFRSTTENRIAYDTSGYLTFVNGTTERARITGGSFLYGCTAAPSSTVKGIGLQPNGTNFFYGSAVDGTGTIVHMEFYNPNGVVGSISTNGSATAYNIASDVRLKKNIVDSQDAGADVDALKVRAFDWKVDDAHVKYGFVAQELAAVAPEAVKVGDDGDEVTDAWGVDYSKLVPMLVKEIQSLRARVAQLEAR